MLFSLRDALVRSAGRVIDLFHRWDEDKSGKIERREFRHAVQSLGLECVRDVREIDLLFDYCDTDGDGILTFRELHQMLRQGHSITLDAPLQAGFKGDILPYATQRHALRKRGSLPKTRVLRTTSSLSVREQLQKVLVENAVHVIDVFRMWDDDGNGRIDRREFRRAISALGYDAPNEHIDVVFDSFDHDGSGALELHELEAALASPAEHCRAMQQGHAVRARLANKYEGRYSEGSTGSVKVWVRQSNRRSSSFGSATTRFQSSRTLSPGPGAYGAY